MLYRVIGEMRNCWLILPSSEKPPSWRGTPEMRLEARSADCGRLLQKEVKIKPTAQARGVGRGSYWEVDIT